MKRNAPKSGGWKRIFILIAVVYTIPVAFAAWTNFPTRAQIEADVAAVAMSALQQYDPKYKDLAPLSLRRRLYRGLSDEEVTARVREYAVAEEKRINAQADRISIDAQQAGIGLFSSALAKPEEQLASAAEPAPTGMRPQIALTMEDLDKRRAERLGALKFGQAKVIAWAVAGWVLPLVVLYVLLPRFSRRSRRSHSRL